TKKSAEEKEKKREEKAAAREAEKERKRIEKERAKENRALEREKAAALAAVNKIRTDKKVSTPEMIVDFPTSINYTIKLQAETLLKDLDVESSSWHSPVENVVKWRRKIKSRYNEELEHWEPIPMRVESETYAMVIVPADQFVELALGQSNNTLESHVVQMQTHFPSHTIIYLLEGISLWLRKNRTVRNRQFVSAVRDGLGGEQADAPPPSTQSRRRKAAPVYIDEDTIEDALLQLQVLHGALIHHTSLPLETAQWIAVFTQHISTVPYRRQREETNAASAGFCMESGQVRTGDGARDTYLRMLQEVGRVTAPIAYGIASEYDSVAKLVRGLEEHGPLVLEKVRKSANKDGAYSDRTVGQAVSRRLHKIFTGREEGSTDI
ncbi:ERCC4 domain-containing protein, partial [Lasiosphaeris hirsuta]